MSQIRVYIGLVCISFFGFYCSVIIVVFCYHVVNKDFHLSLCLLQMFCV